MTITPMSLGDLFDRWFKLIGKTWLRNLILAAIIMGPATLILAMCMDVGFGQIAGLADFDASDSDSGFNPALVEFLAWFLLGLTLFFLGTVGAMVAVTMVGCAEMSGKPLSWQEALQSAFAMPFLRIIAQYLLLGIGFVLLAGIPYALIAGGIAAESVGLGLFGGLLLFVMIPAILYLSINFAFLVPAVTWENESVIGAFRRSWELVRGNWWRTFGILILMNLVVSFAVSIVMTPFSIIILWDFFLNYFEMLGSLGGGEPDSAFAREMIASYGFAFGIVNALSSIAQVIVAPLYLVVMYFDLRARKGEFHQSAEPAPAPIR
ncbi:MAG: hypothetical protein WEB37_06005 [Bacteroidota bacterium]